MEFSKHYQQALVRKGYHRDEAQAKIVSHLDDLYKLLLNSGSGSLYQKLPPVLRRKDNTIKGCYLWGGVGQGKTWLMDLFFAEAPTRHKLRFHFHEFMQHIHQILSGYRQQKNPLKLVAGSMREKARLFCLDEFHVLDIADAMLLYGLLHEMYKQGAVFVITSNVQPEELYKNGLQRSRFLPAIDLIKSRNHVLQLDGKQDYRLQTQLANRNYYCPLQSDTDDNLQARFNDLAIGEFKKETAIHINKRAIPVQAVSDNVVWFEFKDICGGPRAAVDYIALAQAYDIVMIANIFKMDESYDDMARRFINLVDAFYDRGTGLIVSATVWPKNLYSGRRFRFEFSRTISRLEEIRSRSLLKSGLPYRADEIRIVSP